MFCIVAFIIEIFWKARCKVLAFYRVRFNFDVTNAIENRAAINKS